MGLTGNRSIHSKDWMGLVLVRWDVATDSIGPDHAGSIGGDSTGPMMLRSLTVKLGLWLRAGSHTLGGGHCKNIEDRLPINSPTAPKSLVYRTQLRAACAVNVFNVAILNIDASPFTFDNRYFKDIQNGRGLFTVDNLLATDPRTAPVVSLYASNQGAFFAAFQTAYVKLVSRALTGTQGSVRATCQP